MTCEEANSAHQSYAILVGVIYVTHSDLILLHWQFGNSSECGDILEGTFLDVPFHGNVLRYSLLLQFVVSVQQDQVRIPCICPFIVAPHRLLIKMILRPTKATRMGAQQRTGHHSLLEKNEKKTSSLQDECKEREKLVNQGHTLHSWPAYRTEDEHMVGFEGHG